MAQIKAFVVAWKWFLVGGVVLMGVAYGVFSSLSGGDSATQVNAIRSVKVARVSDLMGGGDSLSVVAEIQSVSEAKISPEIGGRISRVRSALGAQVAAGQILAEIENASQRAAVLQAEGAYDAAKAALLKVHGGTREEQLAILNAANEAAKSAAVNTLLSAYATFENAVRDDIDPLFTNPNSAAPTFILNTSESMLTFDLQNQRPPLNATMARQSALARSLSPSSDLVGELNAAESELRKLRGYLDLLIRALNNAIPNEEHDAATIAGFVSSASGGRTSVTTSLSAIASARSGLETAAKNLQQGEMGAQNEDVSAAEAAVKQAQGAYNAALANLEKTIIRSPISGSLNNFTIKLGDTVAPSQQVAIVSNNAALEAVAYITEEDRARVQVGDAVSMEGSIEGTITKIAPALDPVTRRIEVRIGLPASVAGTVTNGQSVRVELSKRAAGEIVSGPISIPITAIKIEATRTIVFVVQDGKLAASPITIGKLSGDSVQVTEGLAPETEIVVDARGLKDGQEVRTN